MSELIRFAREVQAFAAKQLYVEEVPDFTDVEEWNQAQLHLVRALAELERMDGTTPEEEGELALAILMGYSVAIRNARNVQLALERAKQVMPRLTDEVLKCKLAVFCYIEIPSAELAELIKALLVELKRQGKEEEIRQAEKQFLLLAS